MKKVWFIALIIIGTLLAAACSANNANTQPPPTPTQTSVQLPQANLAVTVLGVSKLGPDGKLHDAFSPANFTVTQGQVVNVTAYNYDDMPHSFTSADLGVDQQLAPSTQDGQPGVTTFTFTATKAGTYEFHCEDPCDTDNGQWSMYHMGYMIGQVIVQPATQQPQANLAVTVLGVSKLGPDGNLHDAFSPANFTVTQGQVVNVTAYNYDDMPHSFTSADLGVDQQLAPSTQDGQPGVTTFTFTATKAGTYEFRCEDPCDTDNGQWSMYHMGYMIGQVIVQPATQ